MTMLNLAPDLVDRALTRHPVPIADATSALAAADSLLERRDRVVETFRTVMRFLGSLALAARVQYGPGPGSESMNCLNSSGTGISHGYFANNS